jgi:hypothetical protein
VSLLEIIREDKFIIEIKRILVDIRKKEELYRCTIYSEENNRRAIEFLIKLL